MEILLFGITRDIVGSTRLQIPEAEKPETVGALKTWLSVKYPAFAGIRSIAVAIDNEYATDEQQLHAGYEIALIPPVSGG